MSYDKIKLIEEQIKDKLGLSKSKLTGNEDFYFMPGYIKQSEFAEMTHDIIGIVNANKR